MPTLASPLRIPLVLTGRYGNREPVKTGSGMSAKFHAGADVRAPKGTPFYPLEPGVVRDVRTGWTSAANPGIERDDLFPSPMAGNYAVVDGKHGTWIYGHADRITCKVGGYVGLDTMLGTSGTSGDVAPHLHVGLWRQTAAGRWYSLDPTPYLPLSTPPRGPLMALSDLEQQELLDTTRAIREGQVHPGGYTYDAAILNLVQGLYGLKPTAGTATVDVAALAAQLRDTLGPDIAGDLADELADRLGGAR